MRMTRNMFAKNSQQKWGQKKHFNF